MTTSFIVFAQTTQGTPNQFSRNLKLGDAGEDVKSLQVILNSDPRTRVSDSGPGSPSMESTYFGTKTKEAVMRFQNLYRDEILVKAGFPRATGVVGLATREKLVNFNKPTSPSPVDQKKSSVQNVPKTTASIFASSTRFSLLIKKVNLYQIVPFQVLPSGTITLIGSGFGATENTVHIGEGYSIPRTNSADGTTMQVQLPSNVVIGTYDVWVENKNNTKKDISRAVRFMVTNTPVDAPEITSISPSVASAVNTTVTLSGSNFSLTSNNIYSSLGNILGTPSSDGKTLTIDLKKFEYFSKIQSVDSRGLSVMLWISIQNENGISKKPFSIEIRL